MKVGGGGPWGPKKSQLERMQDLLGETKAVEKLNNSFSYASVSDAHIDAEITVDGNPNAMHLQLYKFDDYTVTCTDNRTGANPVCKMKIDLDNPDAVLRVVNESIDSYRKSLIEDNKSVDDLVFIKRDLDSREIATAEASEYSFADKIDRTGKLSRFIAEKAVTYSETEDYVMFVNENNRGVLINDRYIVPFVVDEEGKGTINLQGMQRYNQFDIDTGRLVTMVEESSETSLKTWFRLADLDKVTESENPGVVLGNLDTQNSMWTAWSEGESFRDFVMNNDLAYKVEIERGRPVITVVLESEEGAAEAFMIRERGVTLSLSHMVEGENGMELADSKDFGNDYSGHQEIYNYLDNFIDERIAESNVGFSLDD